MLRDSSSIRINRDKNRKCDRCSSHMLLVHQSRSIRHLKNNFFFFSLSKNTISLRSLKNEQFFNFSYFFPSKARFYPISRFASMQRNFPRNHRFIDLLRIERGKKNRIVYQENEGNIDCFAVISLITNDKKSTESRPLLSRKPIDHPSTSVHSDRVRKREESEEDSLLSSSERRGCSRKKIARSRRVGKGSKGKGRR